jgi:GWxTD domain-containing protein
MTLTPLANAFGWTLLHSLWEGAAVALALAAALGVIRSSRARYAAGCAAMLGILAGFVFTAALEMPERTAITTVIPRVPAVSDGGQSLSGLTAHFGAADLPPYLAALWIAGVVLFHLRSVASWMAARRLRRRGVCIALEFWQRRLAELRESLRLGEAVTLLESCLAGVPVVVGYLRPVILVPVGMLASMPAGQIEAILLHELAHIRRRDYLVNLLQTVVENFLFYHPAVWWISGVIRSEREHCCDDLVVATRGNAGEYAMALTVLENNRCAANKAVLAANGGNLMRRITRILYPLEGRQAALAPVVLAGVLTLVAAVALSAWQSKPVESQTDPYKKWLNEDVTYIIDAQERAAYLGLGTDEERDHFIVQFWERRDPTPGTARNEFKEEHYRRIGYVNGRYTTAAAVAGWKTDRGRIYISFGPPDEMESHPSGGAVGAAYEDWLYRKITGMGERVVMRFVDKSGNGDYQMTP